MYSETMKRRIIYLDSQEIRSTSIVGILKDEGFKATAQGVIKFLKRYKMTGSVERKRGSGRQSIVNDDILEIIEDSMTKDDETTATQLKKILDNEGHCVSLSTILRHRLKLGWTFRGSAYCQLIREANKIKRKEWCLQYYDEVMNEELKDVVWTDETSIQLETHRRFCCRKRGQPARLKPRYSSCRYNVHVYKGYKYSLAWASDGSDPSFLT
jgi:transposase